MSATETHRPPDQDDPLPEGVRLALDAFAAHEGRTWRSKLRWLWLAGTDTGPLREARNMVGPSGLAAFRPRPYPPRTDR